MKVRTVLYPMNGQQDVLVLQYSLDGTNYTTMPLVSGADLSDDELQEIATALDTNENVAESYIRAKQKANEPTPEVVEVQSEEADAQVESN